MRNIIFLIILLGWFACTNKKENNGKIKAKENFQKTLSFEDKIENFKINKSGDSILSNDIQYINDSILKRKFKLDISQYNSKDIQKKCLPNIILKNSFYESPVEGDVSFTKNFKNLGDLDGDKKNDSVFILPSLNLCEEGQSYYFTNNKIPRIKTESNCCHTESIFSIGDIDEDGGNEIAEYYSSCASNFKSIRIWTLKNSQWKSVGVFTFYYNNGKFKAFEDFHKLYKKISKNKFQFLEISDKKGDGSLVMKWHTIKM
ncbi:MAG TPA: hypothetical protein DCQ50_01765 [Chryseobacterium sp.]|nr:hypothetical protein [Chryseobacterium sp.]